MTAFNPPGIVQPSRRQFLRQASLAAVGLVIPWRLASAGPPRPVRIRGAVRASGRGLAGVRVTDGATVVQTARDGTYEIPSDTRRRFVYLTLPAGYAIPQNETGTARFYRPLEPDANGRASAVFDLQPDPSAGTAHRFVVLADTQMENSYEVERFLREAVPDVRATAAEASDCFGVACGDIMFDNLHLFPEYEKGVREMNVPFFQVVGNHDIVFTARSDEHSNAVFEQHFGPAYYSFERGDVHYVVLDDVLWHGKGYIGYIDEAQLAWLEQDLSFVEAGRPVVVFLHIPTLSTEFRRMGQQNPALGASVTNREVLYRMLEPYQSHLIAGHTHEKDHVFEGGTHLHVSGAVCGAWWSGPICWDGAPNGYDVFDVRGEEITWRYKSTGLPAAHQLRVYGHGAVDGAPDEIAANVWDWDPSWTVIWYEDGERRGQMARRTARDPLSVELHTGAQLPPRRPWVEPRATYHMFFAPASREAGRIMVEATDGFGRTYAKTVEAVPQP
jgi:hypothetical protein